MTKQVRVDVMHSPPFPWKTAAWSARGPSADDCMSASLATVLALLRERAPHLDVWFLVGDYTWSIDTRLVRYFNLWRRLRKAGVALKDGVAVPEEHLVKSESGIKFFSGVRLDGLADQAATPRLLRERNVFLLAIPATHSPEGLLRAGWTGHPVLPDEAAVAWASKHGGVLMRRYFDGGPEAGILVSGRADVIDLLLQ